MLLSYLKKIPDNRRKQAQQYELAYILLYTVIALLANNNTYKDISDYIRVNITVLNANFGTKRKKGIGHSGLNKVFQLLNCEAMEVVFREFTKELMKQQGVSDEEMQIAFDGKSLRGSYDNMKGISMLQMVSAYCVNYQLVLGHKFIEGQKTNEIPVVQELIQELGIENAIITADAMHCQKKQLT